MPIGTLRVTLRLRGVRSLKEKRSAVLPLLARIRHEHRCSAAEVDDVDRWRSSVLEVACVNSDRVAAERALHAVLALLERDGLAEIVDHQVEIA